MSTPDYTQQMEWQSTEPAILTWQIKTIAHQWQKLGYFCIFVIVTCILISLGIFVYGYSMWMYPFIPLTFMLPFVLGLFGEVRRKVWLVYRFTQRGAEICRWRAYPKSLFTGIRVIFIGLGIAAVIAGFMTEMGLLVIAGPVSIALAWGSFAFSQDYEKDMRAFSYRSFDWAYIKEATYDVKRNVLCLHYIGPPLTFDEKQELFNQGFSEERINAIINNWDTYIFPTPELTEQVIQLVESSLQNGVKLEWSKVELPEIV